MAPGLPDLVDCMRLAVAGDALSREFALTELPRLKDLLAGHAGRVHATFAFSQLASGRAAATIMIEAAPTLTCQRCMQPFALPLRGHGEVEFIASEDEVLDSEREPYLMQSGMVSLREMAEEEVLMALPAAAACSSPQTCAHAALAPSDAPAAESSLETRRPFAGLKELLKKT